MNPLTLVKRIQKINQREASLGISDEASWHAKYKDSAYVFVGGIPFDLTEGDLLAVFAQYGEIVDVNLVRDKGTGKSKGFAFVAYEDQRSTNLAVDNLNGAQILGRIVRVDHCSNYKKKEEEDEEAERQKREARGVCRAFQKGECNRGASCKFSHDEQRAANTGWGAEEDRRSRFAHEEFEGSRKIGRPSNQPARELESAAREGHRANDKDSKVSKGKYESMTTERHHDRSELKPTVWDNRDAEKGSGKGKEMDYKGDRDRSHSDRKSSRHDEPSSREDPSKRDDRKFRRHEPEFHRKEERDSREDGNKSANERNSSPRRRRTDDDEQMLREDRGRRDEKRSRGHRSESYHEEAWENRGGDKRPGYDKESSPRHRRTDEDRGHRSHR